MTVFYKMAKFYFYQEYFRISPWSNVFTIGIVNLVCVGFLLVLMEIVHFLLCPIKKHFDSIWLLLGQWNLLCAQTGVIERRKEKGVLVHLGNWPNRVILIRMTVFFLFLLPDCFEIVRMSNFFMTHVKLSHFLFSENDS